MQIKKETKFFASHRNQDLNDKCRNLHGHTYFVSFFFNVARKGSISTLFSDLEDKFNPVIQQFDHASLWDKSDELYKAIITVDPTQKVVLFDEPTSVENICYRLFTECIKQELSLDRIELKETTTSTVIYYVGDWHTDHTNRKK